jgi:uncharacterized protein YjcR
MTTRKNNTAKERARELLLQGLSHSAICEQLDIEPRTIKRWLSEKEFKENLRNDSRIVHNNAIIKAIGANDKAIDTLLDIMENGTDRNRLTAAKTILECSVKWLDTDLEARLESLEEIVLNSENGEDD